MKERQSRRAFVGAIAGGFASALVRPARAMLPINVVAEFVTVLRAGD